ncbi:hypothetical protein ACRAWF_30360 [Streptomyces sp. L7]
MPTSPSPSPIRPLAATPSRCSVHSVPSGLDRLRLPRHLPVHPHSARSRSTARRR